MKHLGRFLAYLLFLSITSLPSFLHSQVYTGNIDLTNQAQVDTFSYTEVTGSVFVLNGVVNLDSLNSLVKIGGMFKANSSTLTSINGVSGLKTIGGNVEIINCPVLQTISGLQQIDSIAGNILINYNPLLTEIDGLNPEWVGGYVKIWDAGVLEEITGFSQMTSCGGILLSQCPQLKIIDGFSNVQILHGLLGISHCHSLQNLDAFASVTTIGGELSLSYNGSIENIDSLSSVTKIYGDLYIGSLPLITSFDGLSSLTYVGEGINISSSNPALTSLSSFSNLTKVNGNLSLSGFPGIKFISGFGAVDTINGKLGINMDSLINLTGFDSLRYVKELVLIGNPQMTSTIGLGRLEAVGPRFSIAKNNKLNQIEGFLSLKNIEGGFYVAENPNLTSITGFNHLKKIESAFFIRDNSSLFGIDGFAGLDSIFSGMEIRGNPNLYYIKGFDSLSYIKSFPPVFPQYPTLGVHKIRIYNNPNLVDVCGLFGMFTQLAGTILVSFHNNYPGLTTYQVIQNGACDSVGYPTYGNLYLDADSSCTRDSMEWGLANVLIKSGSGTSPRFAISDSLGNFEIFLDSGFQTLEVVLPIVWSSQEELLSICDTTISVNVDPVILPIQADDWGINIPNCPMLRSKVVGLWHRTCIPQTIALEYSNLGNTGAALSKYYLKLPYYLTILSSSAPYQIDQNGLIVFDLGTIPAYSSGTITLQTQSTCNVYLRDIEQCLETWITSPSTCVPSVPGWSGASLELLSECQGDTAVHFQVINQGSGPMLDSTAFRLFGNQSVAATGKLKLDSTNSFSFVIPSDTKTYRLEVDQVEFHPFGTEISAAVEGCYAPINSMSSTRGQISIFPRPQSLNLGSYFAQCRPIINAFDPNDKKATPVGFGPDSIIHPETTISYRIRFQNTGNDTAFNILLVDTLDAALDVASLRILSASHSFTPSITGGAKKILKFKFSDILLPDSTTNEPGSHGYIEFEIDHIAGIPLGTEIQNFADIYFDFNPPIRTNTTHQTVDTITLDTLPVSYATFSSNILPDTPGLLTIKDTLETYSLLTWTASATGEFAYIIERAQNDSTVFNAIDTVSMVTFSLMDSFPDWDDTYFYRVRAMNAGGISEPTNIVSQFSAIPSPLSPEIDTIYQSGPSGVVLEWTDSTVLCSEYLIERSEDSVNYSMVANAGSSIRSYEDSVPAIGQGYWYRVSSVNPSGISTPSEPASLLVAIPIPQAPSDLMNVSTQPDAVLLSWTDHSEFEEGFILERGNDSTQMVQLAILGKDVTSFQDSSLSANLTAYYRLKAFNASGESDYSNVLAVDFTLPIEHPFSGIEVFPNPFEDQIFLSIPEGFSETSVLIYNSLGELVMSQSLVRAGRFTLDLQSLAKGPYFLRITSSKGSASWPILKQ